MVVVENRETHMHMRKKKIRLWDLPVRLTHWGLAVLFAGAWWSAEQHEMDLHRYCGYAILTLVLFRFYWGIAGSETSRFASFVAAPRAIVEYLRGMPGKSGRKIYGHNPLGALSVLALLGLLAAQVTIGLFVTDIDGIESGPLSAHIDFDTSRMLADWHQWAFNLLLGFVALHLAAVTFYLLVKRDNLIGPMISGHKSVDGADAPALHFVPAWRALVGIVGAAAITWAIVTFG